MAKKTIDKYLRHHFRHFNVASLIEAADAYTRHIDNGGLMFMSVAGAMSTAELGVSL
ncbi:MAG: deoxyhypusine synthase, partial [Ignavibacteria bacterium]|nr:deoxyhypusine synthase [Ignavibacteria bacterium]